MIICFLFAKMVKNILKFYNKLLNTTYIEKFHKTIRTLTLDNAII